MYEVKPRIFNGAKLVTVFDGTETQCYCIGYHMLAKAIVLLKGSMDKAVFVRQYEGDNTEQFEKRIANMQRYIDSHRDDIRDILIFAAGVSDVSIREYMEIMMDKIENEIAVDEEMSEQFV